MYNYMWNNSKCRFVDLKQVFYRCYCNVQNDEHVHLLLKNLKQESTRRVELYYEILYVEIGQ
jgi:hypothetical protein